MTHQTKPCGDSLTLEDAGLLQECEVDTFRARGPGGQKRNKTDSAVRLRHRPTGLTAIAVETRSQHQNKAHALRRLRHALALDVRRLVSLDAYAPSTLLTSYVTGGRARPVRLDSGCGERADAECAATADCDAGPPAAPIAEDSAGGALTINLKNPDYPLVLREVFDVLFLCGLRPTEAAARMGLTTSQLVKFLRRDHLAWGRVNQERVRAGAAALR